ncbi:unnamed protein product [Rhizophagus irregularis]|uniref:Uncharacterized protein n=1 Tax=Rhizophagus irregularis TaxID=588596 RepID=A0A916EDQ0_9GLOM|nr:unnamed protein product [Rhizophagus irregularis]CAB5382915.1 unnamed protein product [Rhizophagus irregularis]
MEVNETIRVQSQNFGMKDTKRNGAIWFGFRASERRMPIKTEQTRFSLGASERMALIERNNTFGKQTEISTAIFDEPYLHNKGRQTLENETNLTWIITRAPDS